MRGIWAMIVLDMKRLWLDRSRLAFGLIQPVLYLFVFGSGLGSSSQLGLGGYRSFIFPGVIGMALLFSSTFAAISIVFDRQIGFLKAVLVAPVPRSSIAIGKILTGALQAIAQNILLLVFAPLVGVHLTVLNIIWLMGAIALAAVVFSALGVAVASRFSSTTVFPVVTNAVLFPMFFLSGAMYPLTSAPRWMQWISHLDPVAYAVDLIRGALTGQTFFPVALSLGVLAAMTAWLTWISVRVFSRGEDAQLGASRLSAFRR